MPEPTPAEIEAGAKALERLVAEHPRADRRTVARWVLRAVLPDHDARVRARVAEEFAQACLRRGREDPDAAIEDAAAIARAQATTPTTEEDPNA